MGGRGGDTWQTGPRDAAARSILSRGGRGFSGLVVVFFSRAFGRPSTRAHLCVVAYARSVLVIAAAAAAAAFQQSTKTNNDWQVAAGAGARGGVTVASSLSSPSPPSAVRRPPRHNVAGDRRPR